MPNVTWEFKVIISRIIILWMFNILKLHNWSSVHSYVFVDRNKTIYSTLNNFLSFSVQWPGQHYTELYKVKLASTQTRWQLPFVSVVSPHFSAAQVLNWAPQSSGRKEWKRNRVKMLCTMERKIWFGICVSRDLCDEL